MGMRTNFRKWIFTHLQHVLQLHGDPPLIIVQLVPVEVCRLVAGDVVNGQPVFHCEFQHVVCGVPSCCHIARHFSFVQVQGVESLEPQGKEKGCRVENGKGDFTKL
jgi:hypothetical protein